MSIAILCVFGGWVQAHLTGTPPALQRLMCWEEDSKRDNLTREGGFRLQMKGAEGQSFKLHQVLRIRLYGGNPVNPGNPGTVGGRPQSNRRIVDSALPRLVGNETQGPIDLCFRIWQAVHPCRLPRTHGLRMGCACRRQLPLDLGEGDKFRSDRPTVELSHDLCTPHWHYQSFPIPAPAVLNEHPQCLGA